MGKIKEVQNLYKETLNDIASSEDNWLSFLNSASYNFKYDFIDKVLIYAQNPNATACADMETWNKKVKRWVNKNAKVIFVTAKENSQYPYRMVFDVEETHNYKNTPYKLWEVKPEYESEIIETLESSFGEMDSQDNLTKAIIQSSYNMVMDNFQDYLLYIQEHKVGTELENMSDDEIQVLFIPTLWASVSYMMMRRCGINAEKEIGKTEFSYISKFSNENLLTIFGTATSDIAEQGLREIAKAVINLQKDEKKLKRTFVKNENIEYSENRKNIEGGKSYGENRIHETRRLYDTKYNIRGGKTTSREIRNNEIELSKTTQESRIHDTLERQEISTTLDRDTGTSNRENSIDSKTNETTERNNRRVESQRPDELDRSDEQYSSSSRGTSSEGTNLQLDLLSEDEQKQIITEVENTSVFPLMQDKENLTLEEKLYKFYNNYDIYDVDEVSINQVKDGLKDNESINKTLNYLKEIYEAEDEPLKDEFETELLEIIIELEKLLPEKEHTEEYSYLIGDNVFIGTEEYQIVAMNGNQISIADTNFPLLVEQLDFKEFDKRVKENPYNEHLKSSNRKIKKQSENEFIENKIANDEQVIKEEVQNKEISNIVPHIKRKRRNKIEYFDLHPDVPLAERNNFKIKNDDLGIGTKKEKYKNNIEAIKILKQCEEQNRYATKKEQDILSKYVGWGGIPEAFDGRNDNWHNEYEELKSILAEKEYNEAKKSTLTAFYTPPVVIRTIYRALENMGLAKGNILEPSCRYR